MRFRRLHGLRRLALAGAAPSAAVAIAVLALGACGSRTGLLTEGTLVSVESDAGPLASNDGGPGSTPSLEDGSPADGPSTPVVDAALPPIDAASFGDASINDCPNASATLIYLVSDVGELVSYYPPTQAFRTIGILACPAAAGTQPFSMAVDHLGVAYVLFQDGTMFRASTLDAACTSLPYVSGQAGFLRFGMGYAADDVGGGERLYVASDDLTAPVEPNAILGTIDAQLTVTPIGVVQPAIFGAELTGTGGGRLFAYYKAASGLGSAIGEIDKATARLVAETPLPTVTRGDAWAFAFWGGDFYTFTAPGSVTAVSRFRPSDGSVSALSNYPGRGHIVGAGVSTCAPAH